MTHTTEAYDDDFGGYRLGEGCQWPPVLERFVIPQYAKRLRRGWVWYEDLDRGDPEVGPRPHVVRCVLPRAMCARVIHLGDARKTVVHLPAEYAYENCFETTEARARLDEDEAESLLWRYAR